MNFFTKIFGNNASAQAEPVANQLPQPKEAELASAPVPKPVSDVQKSLDSLTQKPAEGMQANSRIQSIGNHLSSFFAGVSIGVGVVLLAGITVTPFGAAFAIGCLAVGFGVSGFNLLYSVMRGCDSRLSLLAITLLGSAAAVPAMMLGAGAVVLVLGSVGITVAIRLLTELGLCIDSRNKRVTEGSTTPEPVEPVDDILLEKENPEATAEEQSILKVVIVKAAAARSSDKTIILTSREYSIFADYSRRQPIESPELDGLTMRVLDSGDTEVCILDL